MPVLARHFELGPASATDLSAQLSTLRDQTSLEISRLRNRVERLESWQLGVHLRANSEARSFSKLSHVYDTGYKDHGNELVELQPEKSGESKSAYAPLASNGHAKADMSDLDLDSKKKPLAAWDIEQDEPDEGIATSHDDPCRLAYARTSIGITMRLGGTCAVESSAYGAAMLMPQLARTVGWDSTFTSLAIRSLFFLCLNVLLQAYLLTMIHKEEAVLDLFGGQMFLCDFGANFHCPGGPGCRGPLGTQVEPSRLYNWAALVNRRFVKDSITALFPDRLEEISSKIDVGEYGMESWGCRWVCCFIFMIACLEELVLIMKFCQLLIKVPTKDEPWIIPKLYQEDEQVGALDEVTFKLAGMPLRWKLFNGLVVLLPKTFLWIFTCQAGITFLMETSTVDNIVINSVALTFILGIDELIASALMDEETLNMMEATEDFELYDATHSSVGDLTHLSEDEIVDAYYRTQHGKQRFRFDNLKRLFPFKLVVSMILTGWFMFDYYSEHCERDEEEPNHWVSKAMHLPKSKAFSTLNAFLPSLFPVQFESTPYWTMPALQSEQ